MDGAFYWIGFVLTAWLTADFLTGLFHWFEDRYANPKWPVFGPLVAAPNELHHSEPRAFLRGSYWDRNNTTLIPCLTVAALLIYKEEWWWALVACFAAQANELHAFTHRAGIPRPIRVLQDTDILQNARHHARHHISPYASHFCVMSSWLNPILDAVGFWRFLESLVYLILLVKPKQDRMEGGSTA